MKVQQVYFHNILYNNSFNTLLTKIRLSLSESKNNPLEDIVFPMKAKFKKYF